MKANLKEELFRIQNMMRVLNENESFDSNKKMGINDVLTFGYDFMMSNAPEGPKNREEYAAAINDLESCFASVIKNISFSIAGNRDGSESPQDMSDM